MRKNSKKKAIAIIVLLVIVAIVISITLNNNVSLIQQTAEREMAGSVTITGWTTVELTTDDGLSYSVKLEHYSDDTTSIIDYIDSAGTVESLSIPSQISSYTITGIGEYAFASATALKTVTVPEGVTSLGDYSFQSCTNLETITLPSTIESIGTQAFNRCTNLKNINLPEGLVSIGYAAFYGCESLESISIPNSVTSLGELAFDGCTKLQSITISSNITEIGRNTFQDCTSLQSIVIPDGVTSLGEFAFEGCTSLRNVTMSENIKSIERNTFQGCTSLQTIVIPDGVTSIAEYAFEGCTSLQTITIPSNVTSIGKSAFNGCTNLKTVAMSEGVTSIGESAFSGCTSLQTVTIPESVTSMSSSVFEGCTSLQNIVIPDGVAAIGSNTFNGCTNLQTVIIQDGVTSIGYKAFEGCTNLQTVTIPSSVTSIADSAFENCGDNLTIKCDENSAAYTFAVDNGIQYTFGDNISPTGIVTYSPTTPTNGTVTATITANEELQEIDGWTISSDKLQLTKTYDDNITTTVTIKDLEGNPATVEINISNIDKVAPKLTVSYSTTEETYDPVTIKITSNEELRPLSIDGWVLSDDKMELTATYDANMSGVLIIRDLAGNESEVQVQIENIIDKTYRIVLNKNGGTGGTDYLYVVCNDAIYKDAEHTQKIEVVTDGTLKIDEIPTREGQSFLGYNTKQDNSGETEINSNGELKYSIYSYMVWSYNSIEDYNLYAQWLDNTPPEVTVSYSTTEETYDSVTATIISNEVLQPLEGWTLIGNCKTMEKKYTKNTEEEVTVSDEAGNTAKVNIKIENIKNKEYKIVLNKNGGTGGTDYLYVVSNDGIYKDSAHTQKLDETNGRVTISELPTKEGLSFNGYSTKQDGGNIEIDANGQTGLGTYQYMIYTYNSTEDYNLYAQWIDNIAPKVTITYSTTEQTEGSVTVTITSNEQMQELEGWTLSSDKLKLTKTYDENKTETIKISDIAGNETTVDIKISNIVKNGESTEIKGDINKDGVVDVTDLLILKRHIIAGDKTEWIIPDDKITLGDVNEDGKIDITDLLLMKRIIIAKEES